MDDLQTFFIADYNFVFISIKAYNLTVKKALEKWRVECFLLRDVLVGLLIVAMDSEGVYFFFKLFLFCFFFVKDGC